MSSTISTVDISKAQTNRKITPAQIHPPASRLFGASDPIIGKTNGHSIQGHTGNLETPLDILSRLATEADPEEKVTSYCIRRAPKSFAESVPTTTLENQLTGSDPVSTSVSEWYTNYNSTPIVSDTILDGAADMEVCALAQEAPQFQPALRTARSQIMIDQPIRQSTMMDLLEASGNIRTSDHDRAKIRMLIESYEGVSKAIAAYILAPPRSLGIITDETRIAAGDPARMLIAEHHDASIEYQPFSTATPVKRKWEEEDSDLATIDGENECAFDDDRRSKKLKLHCDCAAVDRTWWMTVSIDSVREALRRMDDAIEQNETLEKTLTKVISDPSNGLSQECRNILDEVRNQLDNDFIYESRDILNSLKDEMKREGGRERDDLE